MNIGTSKKKTIICSSILGVLILIIVYLFFVIYFNNHFYFKTSINGINASGKTVDEFNTALQESISNYVLKLEGRDGTSDSIISKDIKLKCNPGDEIKRLKANQNPLNVFKGILVKKEYEANLGVSYDENLLKQLVDKSAFFDSNKLVKPVNASIRYVDNTYTINPEIIGNKVNKDALYKTIEASLLKNVRNINLDKSNIYENPRYTAKSKEVIDAKATADKYIQSVINYNFRGTKVEVDGKIINEFITVDENLNVDLDEKKVISYIDTLAYNHNTIGITRSFVTTSGKTVRIDGGNYGWAIDRVAEREALIQSIKEGRVEDREPTYIQTTPFQNANEVGKSYVEIDLTKQKLWVYKEGKMISSGDVVTGNVNQNNGTPEGVYRVNYKQKDAVLRGVGYASPVTFWVPFNNGIGIHDASWRSKFGGEIYKSSGSHGCINSPYTLAKSVFENVESGTPVICYK